MEDCQRSVVVTRDTPKLASHTTSRIRQSNELVELIESSL